MEVGKLGVVGARQMGCGIAQVAAQAGIGVVLVDAQPSLAEKGKQKIGAALAKLVQKGRLTADDQAQILQRIHSAESLTAFYECDVVVEAATENQDLKKKIF